MNYAIELNSVSKEYPGVKALQHFSLTIERGKIHALLGHNGAGKTTVIKIIAGLLIPNIGTVKVLDGSAYANRNRVGYLSERPPLYENMTVESYLDFVNSLSFLGGQEAHFKRQKKEALDVGLEKCSLTEVRKRLIGNLSKGFKQRVGIAQAIMHNPEILILDEPMVGLDPSSLGDIRKIILSFKGNTTVLFSSHQLNEVDILCEEMSLIKEGHLVETGSISEIQKKLQESRVLSIEIDQWHDDDTSYFYKNFPISKLQLEQGSEGLKLKFFSSEGEDIRASLNSYILAKGYKLLSLREERLDIDQIFSKLMQKGDRE